MLTLRLLTAFVPLLIIPAAISGSQPLLAEPVMAQAASIEERRMEGDRLRRQGTQELDNNQFSDAVESLEQALEIYRGVRDPFVEAHILVQLGEAYYNLQEHAISLQKYQDALRLLDSPELLDSRQFRFFYGIMASIQISRLESRALAGIDLHKDRIVSNLNSYSSTESLADLISALENLESNLGGRHPDLIPLLARIGNIYQLQGEYFTAIIYLERAFTIASVSLGPTSSLDLATILPLGRANIQAGIYDKGILFLELALSISRGFEDRTTESEVLRLLAIAHTETGNYSEALSFLEQSLALRLEIGDRQGELEVLSSFGYTLSQMNNPLAEEYIQQGLSIAVEIGNWRAEADLLIELGAFHQNRSLYQEALEFYMQASNLYTQNTHLIGEARALNNIGTVLSSSGRYREALEVYEKGLAIFEELEHRSGIGLTKNNLASLYTELGQYSAARELYEEALSIRRETGERSGEAISLSNIGLLYDYQEQYLQALEYYQKSLEIRKETGDLKGQGIALNNVGLVLSRLGLKSQALERLEEALSIFQRIGDRSNEANTYDSLGTVYKELQDYDTSLASYQRALRLAREVGNRPLERVILLNIGILMEENSQSELAIVFYKNSVNLAEEIRQELLGLPKAQQESYAEVISESYRRLADLLLQQNRVLEAQQVLDLLKVQELDDYLRTVRGNAITANGIEFWQPEQEILERFNAQQQQAVELGQELAELREIPEGDRTPTQQQRIAELVRLEEQLNRQFNDFIESEEILQLVSQLSLTTQRQTLNLEDIARLRDDLRQLNAVLLYPLILDDRLELVITTPNAPPLRRTVPVSRADLNQAILDFRQALEDPGSDAITPAQQLYQWLIEPLEADLASADIDTILYAPDGQLRYIPLAALHDGDRHLVERYAVNNITARSLTDLDAQPAAAPRVLAGAFADQTLSYPVQVGQRSVDFRGLPFAGVEVETLVATLPNTTSFLDQDFSLEAVRSRLNEYDILHFATHAAFVPGIPEDSFILFGNGDRPTLADVRDWSLHNVDLVVLSACETGLGGFGNGEEILGLGYQFQRAGARATIASLWQVNDRGTQELINAFYTALNQEHSKAEALRRAQVALITSDETVLSSERGVEVEITGLQGRSLPQTTELAHPYYWAPFILIGNGL